MYLRTDEETEAVEALCFTSRMADDLGRDVHLWRWVIIALHNAVQGFMVISLRHGNSLDALTKKCAADWLKAHKRGLPYPEQRLDSYLNLYKKVKSKKYGELSGNKRFVPKGTQEESIESLNEIRNDFIHFTPKGWSLEVDGLPQICLDVTALIEFLGWETDNISWHDPNHKEQSQLCAYKLKEQMKQLKKTYDTFNS